MPEPRRVLDKGDKITLVLRCEEPDAAIAFRQEMLDTMLNGNTCHGFVLAQIANGGTVFQELDKANNLLNDIHDYLSRKDLGDEQAEALLDRIETE